MLDPAVTVTIRVFRQCTSGRGLLAVEEPASYPGRYHRKGDPSIWYSSLSARGAWAELFRHTSPEIDPFEIRRRFGSATVRELIVLDLTSPRVRRRIGVTMRELTSEAWGPCLRVARRARRQGLDGLLVPSAPLPARPTSSSSGRPSTR